MTALIVALGVAVVLLGVLVAGLLRSHAEILRRLHALDGGEDTGHGPSLHQIGSAPPGGSEHGFRVTDDITAPRAADGDMPAARDVAGVTPDDDAVGVAVVDTTHHTVLAFLSSGCRTCRTFWETFATGSGLGLPRGTRLVVVTQDPGDEQPRQIRDLAPRDLPLVMSSEAWTDYQVPGSPYFVLVDGRQGRVVGEGSAASWQQVTDLIASATDEAGDNDGGDAGVAGRTRRPAGGRDRAERIDAELQAAGIEPGDPRLYPTGPLDDLGQTPIDDEAQRLDADPAEGSGR